MNTFHGKRVLIIGAARQGLALARYMVREGALVTVNDKQSAESLQPQIDRLESLPIRWVLGEHPLTLLDSTDLMCVSGGVPLTLPIVTEALNRGIPLSNDSQIFMDAVKAPVVGITGSAGKTTTTTLLGRMAEADIKTPRKAWVGGNIGNPLIEFVAEINPNDLVIQEFSSFQLELMTTSPHIAAVLNITPNHLDRHADMAAYISAKSRILTFQKQGDIAVLNRDDVGSWNLRPTVQDSLVTFGKHETTSLEPQIFVQGDSIIAKSNEKYTTLLDTRLIRLPGEHNLLNVLAASALAFALNFSPASIAAGVTGFNGVKHRQQLVRELNGVTWINDSIATAPERTLAALNSFTAPLILLLGGRDKNLSWEELATVIRQRVDHVIVFGEAAEKIQKAIGKPSPSDSLKSVSPVATMTEALEEALRISVSGNVVLLSPGATSFDAFKDFEERGDTFIEWVSAL